jgi:uncharacterized HhH-GPD family protein
MVEHRLPIRPIVDETSAFAFLLGVLFNQRMRAEQAWQAPHVLAERIGGVHPGRIVALTAREFANHFAYPTAIHPFTRVMANRTYHAAGMVCADYRGDARSIWQNVTAATFVQRLQAFPGIGGHKARMALFVATRELGITVHASAGDYSISACGSLAARYHPLHQPSLT